MKYIVVLGGGMADYKKGQPNGKTPLEIAEKPNIDALAKGGVVGLIRTIEEGMPPEGAVANLSLMGYDVRTCYTGRASIEALSSGIDVGEKDTVLCMDFVSLSDEEDFFDKTMLNWFDEDSEDGRTLFKDLKNALENGYIEVFAGKNNRNFIVLRGTHTDIKFMPSCDVTNKKIKDLLPKGEGSGVFVSLVLRANEILQNHPVNKKRREEGEMPINGIWLWGAGTKTELENFTQKQSFHGAVITSTDLIKGIAISGGLDVIDIKETADESNVDFSEESKACIEALQDHDFVYMHFKDPDKFGHKGDSAGKTKAIEKIDQAVGYIVKSLVKMDEEYVIAVLSDHPTPISLTAHTADPVPYLVYNSERIKTNSVGYDEEKAQKGMYLSNGRSLIKMMKKS